MSILDSIDQINHRGRQSSYFATSAFDDLALDAPEEPSLSITDILFDQSRSQYEREMIRRRHFEALGLEVVALNRGAEFTVERVDEETGEVFGETVQVPIYGRRNDTRHLNMTTGEIYRFQTVPSPYLDIDGNPTDREGFVVEVFNTGINGHLRPSVKIGTVRNGSQPFSDRGSAFRAVHPWCREYDRVQAIAWAKTEDGKAHIAMRDGYVSQAIDMERTRLTAMKEHIAALREAVGRLTEGSEERAELAAQLAQAAEEYNATFAEVKARFAPQPGDDYAF